MHFRLICSLQNPFNTFWLRIDATFPCSTAVLLFIDLIPNLWLTLYGITSSWKSYISCEENLQM